MLHANPLLKQAARLSVEGCAHFWYINESVETDETDVHIIRVSVPSGTIAAAVDDTFRKLDSEGVISEMLRNPALYLESLGVAFGVGCALLHERKDGVFEILASGVSEPPAEISTDPETVAPSVNPAGLPDPETQGDVEVPGPSPFVAGEEVAVPGNESTGENVGGGELPELDPENGGSDETSNSETASVPVVGGGDTGSDELPSGDGSNPDVDDDSRQSGSVS